MTQKPPPPDPLVGLLDEIADHQAVTVGVLDEGLQALVRTLGGVQRIEGRDGRDGRDGRNGRDGETVIEFRSGYDQREAWSADRSFRYLGHAVHGTPDDEPGWWIERWPSDEGRTSDLFVVELALDVQTGRLRWSDRLTYSYRRSEARTRGRRRSMAQAFEDAPEEFLAALADVGLPADRLAALRAYVDAYPRAFAAWLATGGVESAMIDRLVADEFPQFSREQRAAANAHVRQLVAERASA